MPKSLFITSITVFCNNNESMGTENMIPRRDFMKSGAVVGIASAFLATGNNCALTQNEHDNTGFSFGVITDLHNADKKTAGTRHYRDSIEKLSGAVDYFKANNAAFLIELGDFIDKANKQTEYGYLAAIDKIFDSFRGPRHYVLGNHDVATFSKAEFIEAVGSDKTYYSFDLNGWHFVVLDANFKEDQTSYIAGNFDWTDSIIPDSELRWLENDLAGRPKDSPAILFSHQNLHNEDDPHGVKNAPEVRALLEKAGNVRAVLQGHMHTGGYAKINGIHYLTFRAAVEGPGLENNAFSLVKVSANGKIDVEGHGQQNSLVLA